MFLLCVFHVSVEQNPEGETQNTEDDSSDKIMLIASDSSVKSLQLGTKFSAFITF